jgi:5S rRNA maturation endonuclease (ribonuclease M5)
MQSKIYKIDILDWLERNFDEVRPATNSNVAVNCWFCIDNRFRLYILTEDYDRFKKGTIYCHNEHCHEQYSFVDLYSQIENVSHAEAFEQLFSDDPTPPYRKAREVLAQLTKPKETQQKASDKPLQWPSFYQPLWGLTADQWNPLMPQYMVGRNITQPMCDAYKLGYCTDGVRWKNRMIIPIYQYGKLVAFQGRAMYECDEKKYLFNTGAEIGSYLFNLDFISPAYDWVILVEGVFDVWGVVRSGFNNVVASFGKHLTSQGVSTLVMRFKKVIILWDRDAKLEIADLAEEIEGMVDVYVTFLDEKDPDLATPIEVANAITNAEPYTRSFKRQALIEKIENGK